MTGSVLSPGIAALILFGVFFLMMFLRVPVAFALGLACLPILMIEPRLDTMALMQETFNAYNSFILLAVPFFLLTANLMNVGGTTDRLMKLSRTMVGHFPGSLAQINVVLSIFFAGISGSSTADAASQSKIFIEAQTKEGYDLSFSVAITAVSAVLAVIIPPSILMIVWGGILTVSIGALFLAGILPGLLIGVAQMATVHAYAKARGYPTYPRVDVARALLRDLDSHSGAHDARHHHRRQDLRLVHGDGVRLHRGAVRSRAVAAGLSRDGHEGPLRRRCSTPASSPASRCSASAPPARSAGCSPTTRSPRRSSPASVPGAWASPPPASSSPSCSWWWAAFSMRFRRSSSARRSWSRWPRRCRWTRCISP